MRRKEFVRASLATKFQSTHPTRECDISYVQAKSRHFYFNPRTLQESATPVGRNVAFFNKISIHAPYKRVRPLLALKRLAIWSFQSTHPTRECDNQLQLNLLRYLISIHAPYKRVRPFHPHIHMLLMVFQSTHPTRECDTTIIGLLDFLDKFQSTHPTRECDSFIIAFRLTNIISIHAPYKRVRLS